MFVVTQCSNKSLRKLIIINSFKKVFIPLSSTATTALSLSASDAKYKTLINTINFLGTSPERRLHDITQAA